MYRDRLTGPIRRGVNQTRGGVPTDIPVQLTPLPLKPSLQAHVKSSTVSVQVALSWQLSMFNSHSLIGISVSQQKQQR